MSLAATSVRAAIRVHLMERAAHSHATIEGEDEPQFAIMLATTSCRTAPPRDQPYTGRTLVPTTGKSHSPPMTQPMFFVVAFASALGITFGGLLVLTSPIWNGSDRSIQGIRNAARRSGWPWWIGHVLHRAYPVATFFTGVAFMPLVGMLGLALAGIADPQPAFERSYLWYLVVVAGAGCIEAVVMVLWAWPKFLATPFDRDVPGALAIRRMGRFMRHRPQDPR
jgi:hypothetical protein